MLPPGGFRAYKNRVTTERQKLTELFARLKEQSARRTYTLGEIIALFNDRSYALLVFFLIVPSLTPIPIPGLGSAFGVLVAIQGLAVIFSTKMWLPQRLARMAVSSRAVDQISSGCILVFSRLEKIVRPRWVLFARHPLFHFLNGVLVFAGGCILSLPLVIPLSNFIPSLMLLFICLGILEDDGLMILLAYLYAAGLGTLSVLFGREAFTLLKDLF